MTSSMREIPHHPNYFVLPEGKIYSAHSAKILTSHLVNGYQNVSLVVNHKGHKRRVHTLIALAFIPNPNNYPIVNHKNGNKEDNSIDNLEWTTYKANSEHAIRTGLNKLRSTPVLQYSLNGEIIKEFRTITQASEETGTNLSSLSQALKLEDGISNNFIWRYKHPEDKNVKERSTTKKIVEQLDENNNVVATYESSRIAAEILDVSEGRMSTLCTQGKKHNGFTFRYKEKNTLLTYADLLEQETKDWRQIDGLSRYKISSDGRVWSNQFRIIMKSFMDNGYISVNLASDKTTARSGVYKVHLLVAMAYIGPIPPAHQVNHVNGIKTDNNVTNLEITTGSENCQHAVDTGLRDYGVVIQLNQFGEEIDRFRNAAEAEKKTGILSKTILAAIARGTKNREEFYWIHEKDPFPEFLREFQEKGVKHWKKHPVHNYLVSPTSGEVWSVRSMTLLKAKDKTYDGLSYQTVDIYDNSSERTLLKKVSELVAETYIRSIEDDEIVINKDNDGFNCNKDNLSIVKKTSIVQKTGRIIQLDSNRKIVNIYENIPAATAAGITSKGNLVSSLRRGNRGGGFYWEYEYTKPTVDPPVNQPEQKVIAKPSIKLKK
jgi:hypothetical protein